MTDTSTSVQPTLWGEVEDRFERAIDRYGIWPTTVWTHLHTDRYNRELERSIGDDRCGNEARGGVFKTNPGEVYSVSTSVFSPAIAAWILNLWAPPECLIFDPFAGGGTRAVMAGKSGRSYVGTEIRIEEVEVVRKRLERLEVGPSVQLIHGDAMHAADLVGAGVADFLYTCPPYWNMEEYGGGPEDLSGMGWEEFCRCLDVVAAQCWQILKPGSYAVWVVGLHRFPDKRLATIHHEVTRAHTAVGFHYREEVMIHHAGTGSIRRVGMFEKGNRLLIRQHEYVQVFLKPE